MFAARRSAIWSHSRASYRRLDRPSSGLTPGAGTGMERSPFHARRLAGIDPGRFELGQLAELPVMTKQQMMASFDELLTDRRVTRARAEQQLAARVGTHRGARLAPKG
jgi:hypothetical protein